MQPTTCPFCQSSAVFLDDGSCPKCRRLVPGASSDTNVIQNPFVEDFPTTSGSDSSTVNPYQSPAAGYSDVDPSLTYGESDGNFLVWLLLSFRGRIPRRAFWGASLLSGFVFYASLFAIIGAFGEESRISSALTLLSYAMVTWTSLAITVKRWHDRNKSGWWILIQFIPCVGPIWQFVEMGCLRGTYGPNNFGDDPTVYVSQGRRYSAGTHSIYGRANRAEPDFSNWGQDGPDTGHPT